MSRSCVTLCTLLVLIFSVLVSSLTPDDEGELTGRPNKRKHTGFFRKQSINKTIPFSVQPGQDLIVIDVDGTIWPYDIDSDPIFRNPFTIRGNENGTALVGNHTVSLYPGVEDTLMELIEKGYVLAAVSLTNSTDKTMALLNAFDIIKHFKYMEMAPGPNKVALVEEICSRSGIFKENVLFFEREGHPDDVLDLIWYHVIIYCVDEKGLTKECASKGLAVYDIRPRKGKHGPQNKQEKREKSNKNKSRPAYEKDGTEIEGFDYNATKIEYIDR